MLMRLTLALLLCISNAWCSVSQGDSGESSADKIRSRIPGEWRGYSVCVDKNSACRDEVNVYRFSTVARGPNEFSATASKVVDGKEVVMGSAEWKFDGEKQVLESQAPAIRLVVNGNQMEGTLTLPSGLVYRRIYLMKKT
jgi:hypothetical protein